MIEKENSSCKKYQVTDQEYSNLQEFLDNLPYIVMIILGSLILFIGIELNAWKWISTGIYLLYGIIGAFWIILFVCPYCHFFGTKLCPCGYGKISSRLRQKKDDRLFTKKFKAHIPFIVPLWIIPTIAGGVFLIIRFSLQMLILLLLFIVNSFIILPLISTKYGCVHCPQRDTCPWMKSK